MTVTSFLIVLFIFILSGVIIMRPFLVEPDRKVQKHTGTYDSLLAERERIFSSIEELDLDYELSKISAREHTRNRDILLSQAAKVLKKLDKYPQKGKSKKKAAAPVQSEDDLEKMINARRKELKTGKANFCSHCGKSVQEDGQFCSHCGEAL